MGQFDVAVSHRLPRVEVGAHIYWAHPFVQWLGKYLPIRPYVIGGPIEQEQAMVIGSRIFMSPAMWIAFKRDAVAVRADCA
jgi:hypothetical protein